jgi:lysophospholipase L1-like esterase
MRSKLWLCSLLAMSMIGCPTYGAEKAEVQPPFILPLPSVKLAPAVPPPIFNPPKVANLLPGDRVVIAGDSITWLGAKPGNWIDTINEMVQRTHPGQNIQIFSAGVPGNTAQDLNKRMDTTVLPCNPTVVVIFIGINNIWNLPSQSNGNPDLTDYLVNLSEIIYKAKNHPGVREVVIMSPLAIGDKYDGENKYDTKIDSMARALRFNCGKYGYPLIDIRQVVTSAEPYYNPDDDANGVLVDAGNVHPSALGNQLLAGAVLMGFGD